MNKQFDLLINSFLSDKVGIAPHFLTPALSAGLQQHVLQLQEDDLMTAAGIGNEEKRDGNQKMRTDKIYWLDKTHGNTFEKQFLQQAEDFIEHLNMTCFAGINDYEFHYAVYEKGSFYKRHKDQFKTDSKRKYSLITYLNDNWMEQDGGQLDVYRDESVQHILPQAQTAVFFRSDETEHAVAVANRSRMSISGWLKRI